MKKVTYQDQPEETTEYLVPVKINLAERRTKSISKDRSLFSSIYIVIILLLYAPVPISQFIIGILFVAQCRYRPFLPIYMILSGISGMLFFVVGLGIFLCHRTNRTKTAKILKPIFIFLFLLVIAWFITGQVIVFEIKVHVDITFPEVPEYCQVHLYKGAYVLIFVDYIVSLITIILLIVRRINVSNSSGSTKKTTKNTIK